jgi:hypothetical protein
VVILRLLLQPAVRLPLRLAVVVVVVCLPFLQNSASTSLASARDSESLSAIRISLMASSPSFSLLVAIPSIYSVRIV